MTRRGRNPDADFLAGDPDAIRTVEGWVRKASGPYGASLGPNFEDVVQDALVELTLDLRRKRFRGEGSFKGYVWRLANHACIDRLRRERSRTWIDVETLDLPASGSSPFSLVAEKDAVRDLLRIFNRLPESCRELFRGILEGKSYQEMSEEIGVAAGTLRVRVARCRQQAVTYRRSDGRHEV